MKYSKKYFFIIFLFCFALFANAKNKTSVKADPALTANVHQWMQNSNLRFLENKGQMADMNHKADNDLLFEVSGKGMDVYITTKGISYVFTDIEKHKKKKLLNKMMSMNPKFKFMNDSMTLKYCRADMNLVGATINKENILKEGESDDYNNYYLSQCPQGVLNVHSYEKITIKNIYPGIDWVLFTNATSGIKYNFVIHPGADASQIKLQYKWTDKPELQSDGSIKINTSMGKITEGTPLSYTDENEQNKIETHYKIVNNEISFAISNYNKNKTLIIDPVLVWATYYGGNVETEPMGIQSDGTNVYVTGITLGGIGFPVYNPGAGAYFQGTSNSYGNVFILQFNTFGARKWATYYGGSISSNGFGDVGNSIYSDGTNVWVTGSSASTNFPVYNPGAGAYFQGTLSGNYYDAFILQFNTFGVRKWATYYGGSVNDVGTSISSDGTNVCVTGSTVSTNFPVYNPGGGAYFQGNSNPYGNVFILQFNITGVRKWATFYGGNGGLSGGGDVGNSISIDGANVWVTGGTFSSNFPVFNTGGGSYFQGTIGSTNENAFVLQFNTSGVRKWATLYGGSGGFNGFVWNGDYGNSISSDGTNVWVTGSARSPDFPTFNPGSGAYFQGTIASPNGDAFILQFSTSGVRKWATYYGGSGNGNIGYGDEGYSISSDGTNVWVTGVSNSIDLPLYNPGCGSYFHGTLTAGDQDVFLLQFSNIGVRKWATFYGTDTENDGCFVSSDGTNVWLTADAADATGYPTLNPGSGAYFENTCAGTDNLLMAQFKIVNSTPIIAIASPDSICANDSSILKANGGSNYYWHPSTGLNTTSDSIVIAKPLTTTVYTVVGTNSCGVIDSTNVTVNIISPLPIMAIASPDSICLGDSSIMKASGGNNYSWHPSTGLNITTGTTVIAKPMTNTIYTVVGTNSCGGIDSAKVTVHIINPPPIMATASPDSICAGDSSILKASGGNNYSWHPSTGLNITTGTTVIAKPLTNTIYTVVGTNVCGGIDSAKITVYVIAPTLITATVAPDTICEGDSSILKVSGGGNYSWHPNTGLNTTSDSVVIAKPIITTTYTVIGTNFCGKMDSAKITVYVEDCTTPPTTGHIQIPNIITPNNDGKNDAFYITNLPSQSKLEIFNRWGNTIYQSLNYQNNWEAADVVSGTYYYLLTLPDGTVKKGFLEVIK